MYFLTLAYNTYLYYATEMMNFADVANDDLKMIDPNFFGLDHIDHGYHLKKLYRIENGSLNYFSVLLLLWFM